MSLGFKTSFKASIILVIAVKGSCPTAEPGCKTKYLTFNSSQRSNSFLKNSLLKRYFDYLLN